MAASEPLYVRPLVFPPPLSKDLDHRIVEKRASCKGVRRQPLERGEMATPKEIRQVCREEK
jgi:hypothetical protein